MRARIRLAPPLRRSPSAPYPGVRRTDPRGSRSLWFWRQVSGSRRFNRGSVVFAFLIPTCPRWTSDFDTNAHHRRLFTAAAWRGLEPAPGSGLRSAFLHLSCSLCTIGQFITNLPFLRLRRTLNAPVSADGTGEELGVVTGLAGVVADLLTGGPQAGAGVLRICQARDPGDTGDQRLPGRIQLASGVEDLNAAMLLAAMPAAVHGLVAVEGSLLGAKPGQSRMQDGLVLLDPDQQGVAGRGGLCKPILLAMQRVGGEQHAGHAKLGHQPR